MPEADPDRELVRDVARTLVAEVAPEELPAFPAVADAYLADPDRALVPPRRRGGVPLEFGVEAVAVLVTPVAIAVAATVVQDIAADLAIRTSTRVAGAVRRLLGRADQHGSGGSYGAGVEDSELTLSREKYAELRASAFDTALAYGLPRNKAGMLADAVVGRMLVGRPDVPDEFD